MMTWISKYYVQLSKILKWFSGIGLLLAALQGLPIARFLANWTAGPYRISADAFFRQNRPAILLPSVISTGLLIYAAQKPKNPILVWGLIAVPFLLAVYNALHELFPLPAYIFDRDLNWLFRLVPLLAMILGIVLAAVFCLLVITGVPDSRTRKQLLDGQPKQSAG